MEMSGKGATPWEGGDEAPRALGTEGVVGGNLLHRSDALAG